MFTIYDLHSSYFIHRDIKPGNIIINDKHPEIKSLI